MAKKASSYEVIVMKTKRLEEEKGSLKRKLDRAKRMEKFDNADEVLKEENRLLKVNFFIFNNFFTYFIF